MKKEAKHQPKGDVKGNKNIRPCIAALMMKVLQDIEFYGAIDARFTEAMMGLLYKTKDKRDVKNYRPITLLNTEYKMYTKALANRLSK